MISYFKLGRAAKLPSARQTQAFTLPEMLVASSVCTLVIAGLVTTHLFALRLFEFTKPKMSASDGARVTISHLVGDVRNANRIRIGQGSQTTFTEAAFGARQQGNAIEVYPTTNTSSFFRYYRDTDQRLKRMASGSTTNEVLANSVSNQVVFTSEDHLGNILTNNSGNRVIGMNLQFTQIEYPVMKIGPTEFYDFYQLRTKITQRKFAQP
jgi:hypothetical protein